MARTKPPALHPGDTVGIVAPASAIQKNLLEAGCAGLRRFGYKPFYFDSILEEDLYFAGSVKRRARELEEMFSRDEVRAIICARGGYGSNYLLDEIDLSVIKSHPKIFVGYSDVTTLLTYFCDAANLITFHGPMVTKDFAAENGIDSGSWAAALSGRGEQSTGMAGSSSPNQTGGWEMIFSQHRTVKPMAPGEASGILYGGCLSILAASLGTPYEIKTAGTILFLEDIAAKPFQIDRMLMQLKLAEKLDQVRGIIFGEMLDCVQHPEQSYTLEEVIMRVVGNLGIPVAFGLPSGHVSGRNITLPLGVTAKLSVGNDVRISILESATTAPTAGATLATGKRA
ncbi:MAG: LD-carboxypeptidase [Acidobacteriales bacterium]|nr:LD-carboxypeptidase [Terriglobales bacterium]